MEKWYSFKELVHCRHFFNKRANPCLSVQGVSLGRRGENGKKRKYGSLFSNALFFPSSPIPSQNKPTPFPTNPPPKEPPSTHHPKKPTPFPFPTHPPPKNRPLPPIRTAKTKKSGLIESAHDPLNGSRLFQCQLVRLIKPDFTYHHRQDQRDNLYETRKLSEKPVLLTPPGPSWKPRGYKAHSLTF